jgi:arylformamidase
MPEPTLYDISRPLHEGLPVWPGDEPVRLEWTSLRAAGAMANTASLRLSVHAGTHLDAPYHIVDGGARVGDLPLEWMVGRAVVADVSGMPAIAAASVDAVLQAHPGATRILFRTGAWLDPGEFPTRYPPVLPEAASALLGQGVVLVGTDAPSVDPFDSEELPAHRALCGAGIPILENLLLDRVPPGEYELIALPLRLPGADASPVRAVLRRP